MLLTVDKLTYRYKGLARPALDGVSFSASSGEYLAVLGANGSGKSTLARCITGLLMPDSGSVNVHTRDRIPSALVFQSPGDQIVAETVELDIAFGPENIGLERERIGERVRQAMDDFSLSPLADSETNGLPTGRKQLLALAGVLVLDPAVLVLDEPTSMLTQSVKGELLARIGRFHRDGGTVIHITHDLEEAFLADRILIMNDGVLAFDGPPVKFAALGKDLLASWGLSTRMPAQRSLRDSGPGPAPLSCRDLSFGPLKGFSAAFPAGSITAVTGESGSGKTLLLEMLAGLRAPDSGAVESDQAAALAVQESESSLFEEFVADDVAFGPRNMGSSGKDLVQRVSLAMDKSGLPFGEFANRRTFTLSGGERRKAALAGIIAMNTPVILLDEPTSALDIRSRGQLLALLVSLAAEGRTVVFTTNRPEECRIADQVLELPEPPPGVSADGMGVPAGGKRTRVSATRGQQTLERLRLGARGSFVKLDTPIHRLPPLFKYLLVFSGVAAALAVKDWPWLILALALSCVPAYASRIPASRLLRGFLKILPWLVLLSVMQYFFLPGSLLFLFFLLRFALLYVPLSVFLFSTSHTEIMYGMEDLLSPLRFFRLPARDASLVTGIVFRFIPLLYGEAERIVGARTVRQAGAVGRRGLIWRVQSMASLFIPLMLRTLTRAERLAEAITARYYGSGKHTRYLVWKADPAQRALAFAAVAVAIALIILSRLVVPG